MHIQEVLETLMSPSLSHQDLTNEELSQQVLSTGSATCPKATAAVVVMVTSLAILRQADSNAPFLPSSQHGR